MIDENRLLGEIKELKRLAIELRNWDYYTGYMSALSTVEGMIASQSEERSENEGSN